MNAKTFPIFDCDSHIVEPPAIWDEYVPRDVRAWVKTQFHFHTDTDVLLINGRAVPASRERSNAAEVGWPGWNKKEIGALTPGTPAWQAKFGRLAGCRDPRARLADMDALGVDQVMRFPSWFVRLPLVREPAAARILATAYNDWIVDYASVDRRRLFPCAMLPIQSVEDSIAELRRVARKGFKAAAVRPCVCNGRYPTLPAFDPLWREFEALDLVLAMHTFPSREALTPLPRLPMPRWLEKFPRLKCAVLESNATWLPLVLARSRDFLDLYAFQRGPKVADPFDTFYRRCFIAFEGD